LLTAFDLLIIVFAIVIMLAGVAKRWAVLRVGREEHRSGDLSGLVGFHEKIMKNRYAGMAHLAIILGFLFQLTIVILAQFGFTPPHLPSRLLSLLTDLLGITMLIGVLFYLARRLKSTAPRTSKRTILPLVVLLLILITGFLAEGARLRIVHPASSWSSLVGLLFSMVLPSSPLLMQLMIRCHFFAVLFFLATLPFTSMLHIVTAPINVYYRNKGRRGELKQMSLAQGPFGAKTLADFTWKQLLDAEACVSCGRCEQNCPALISGKPLSPRKVIQDIFKQIEQINQNSPGPNGNQFPLLEDVIAADEIWSCTTCMACVEHCPISIEPLDKIIDMRRYQVMGVWKTTSGGEAYDQKPGDIW